MKNGKRRELRFRIRLVGIFFCVFLGAIGIRAFCVQILQKSWLSQKASVEYERSLTRAGKRGAILDSNGRELALSIDVTSVAAYPKRVEAPDVYARSLADALRLNSRSLHRKLSSDRSFAWIKRQVTPRERDRVRSLNLRGIGFIPEHSRFYPNRMLAAQLLGFTGIDGRGLEGLEFHYDAYLKGGVGEYTVLKDALGRGFGSDAAVFSDHNGANLVLTIDRTIQYIAEKALEEGVKAHGGSSGIAIVMVPRTGALLAVAHHPFFNPNAFDKFDRNRWRNRAVTDAFEPGSTVKIFSASAALEYGGLSSEAIFFCENGAYRVGEETIHDTQPHGWLTLEEIIKVSSNIGAVKISEAIGPEPLYRAFRDFGFGEKTGIDCPGETSGSLSPLSRWTQIHTGTISFGHGLSVSAVQLITAVCAIANDGLLMRPYVVRAMTDAADRPIKTFGPQAVRRVISAKTAAIVKGIMKEVVNDGGTGGNAALEGYAVCGKTGTAQKIDETGAYAEGKYLASFVGFVPAERPAVAILVIIDEPKTDHYGGTVAAPVFGKIANQTLNYLNIPPWMEMNRLTASRWSGNPG